MSETNLKKRPDRLSRYLEGEVRQFIFAELSPSFLEKAGLDFLAGTEIPLEAGDIVSMQEGGLDINRIAENITKLLGASVHFPHAENYMRFLRTAYSGKLSAVLCSKGAEELRGEAFSDSCIYFRAALLLFPEEPEAMFGYASACREWYLSLAGDEEARELIIILKSESTFYFEQLVLLHPEFSPAFYYLGFAYLNAGLYSKAEAIWKRYLGLLSDPLSEEYEEIEGRLKELEAPVKIEAGINHVLAGRYRKGLELLEPYIETHGLWWPLHYHLASAYRALGFASEAIEGYKKVLELAPSNADAAEALAELYAAVGDKDMAEKYNKKAELLSGKSAPNKLN